MIVVTEFSYSYLYSTFRLIIILLLITPMAITA